MPISNDSFGQWLKYQRLLLRRAGAEHRVYSRSVAALSTGVAVSILGAFSTYFAAKHLKAPGLSPLWLEAGGVGVFVSFGLWWALSFVWFRLREPFALDEERKVDLEAERAAGAEAKDHAKESERFLKARLEAQELATKQLALTADHGKFLGAQLQPRLRFVQAQRCIGAEIFDALELWNDGAAIELNSIRQASYLEFSFAVDPSTPGDGKRFAADADARYGPGIGTGNFGSVLQDRVNLSQVEELLRHPTNPLGLENNAMYTMSLQDEWDLKYVADAWERFFLPLIKRLGIAHKADMEAAAVNLVALNEQSPAYPHVRYIPAYYFHRRDYEPNEQPGRLVTFYAWQDGNPGTNYTSEIARLVNDIYMRFGDKITVARRTFLTLDYTDISGTRCDCTFDVHPRDPWDAVVAKRVTESLNLSMGFEIDMRRITGDSVLTLCSVPPALCSLSKN